MVIIMRRYATDWKLADCLNYFLMKPHPAITTRLIYSHSLQMLKINTHPFSARQKSISVDVCAI